jgi:hypothetical protein
MKNKTLFSLIGALTILTVAPGPLSGQLTQDQKISEFKSLANLYAKRYGPYEWKRDALQFDLMDLSPWLAKVSATKTDLELYDLMSQYVNSLNDAHDGYMLPSNYVASLNFYTDIYDDKLLIDYVDRDRLPAQEFGFYEGYELVSIDDVDAQTLLAAHLRFGQGGNPRSTRRFAAQWITYKPQAIIPNAPGVPEISTVVLRNPAGELETYRIPWTRSGVPLTSIGRFPALKAAAEDDSNEAPPDYLNVLRRLNNCRIPNKAVINFGAVSPAFVNSLPANFSIRLGSIYDDFFSGTFQSGGQRLGYIRIPYFDPADEAFAESTFAKEIAYFQANTDGLVVDVTNNPGGSAYYANVLLSYLIPTTWTAVGFELRATTEWVYAISSALQAAQSQGAPQSLINLYQQLKQAIIAANRAQRGRTDALPLDDDNLVRPPATAANGSVLAYRKPILLLTDEMSASAADMFAATLQDNARAKLFGFRTMGAGGNVEQWDAGVYSQGSATVTESLMSRSKDVVTSDFPVTRYIENVGVRPDIEFDYMTVDNFRKRGAPYVDAFTKALLNLIKAPTASEVKP